MFKQFVKKFIPDFVISSYHFMLAFCAAMIYRFPCKKIIVIGITGTNGKTTTADMAIGILEQAGHRVASISSIKFKIGENEKENKLKMTMPGRFKLQGFLRQAVNNKCTHMVLEVTSEGILQHRHRFIDFDVAVFTNLSPEHIERHKGFENYRKAKGKLFKACKKTHIINIDDENAKYFLQFSSKKKIGFTLKEDNVHITPLLHSSGEKGTYYQLLRGGYSSGLGFMVEDVQFHLKLLGRFNIYNAMAAISIAVSQGVSLGVCQKALAEVKGIPGRMEEVISSPFKVIVDYAFTPNALEQVYKTLQIKNLPAGRTLRPAGLTNYQLPTTNLICVLGACGGGRDKWKRPVLGKIAGKYCKEIILTNEDPYSENPSQILSEIEAGVKSFKFQVSSSKVLDRREAIRKALELAEPGNVVVITGKGSEPWICVANGKKIPWDDREIVREEMKKLKIPLAS